MADRVKAWAAVSRRDLLKAAAIAAMPAALADPVWRVASAAPKPPQLWGVNLAGADFGELLGKNGTEYGYPTPGNIEYYARLGFTLVRIPFKWERMQPDLDAPLAEAELALLTAVVDQARQHGLTVVLDPHNYARRRLRGDGWQSEFAIGSAEVPLASFLDFWRRLADVFKQRDDVIFGLMNEPADMSASLWLDITNATIAAIRATGAANMLFVPGTAYSGAHSWLEAGNTIMERVADPKGNFAIEVHQYLDRDSSGTKSTAVSSSIGSERLEAFQGWARKRGLRAFLGEYGAGREDVSLRALMDLCDELNANSDVWMGSAAWAGGPRWPDDEMFNLEPYRDGTIREQTDVIQSRARPGAARRYWAGASPTLYADFARSLAADGIEPGSLLRGGTPRENRLGVELRGIGAPLFADGALKALFDRDEFTLLLETTQLAPKAPRGRILSCGNTHLLSCSPSGELVTDLAGGLRTASMPLELWQGKRRCALSISGATGIVTIGATGSRPVSGKMTVPLATILGGERPIRIGEDSGAIESGYLCRVIGFSAFLSQEELARNLV